eukprot:COSAG02_NODE_6584_length_3477_cov_2.026643_5_plen_58_part_01
MCETYMYTTTTRALTISHPRAHSINRKLEYNANLAIAGCRGLAVRRPRAENPVLPILG